MVTQAELAKMAGVAEMTVYRYFTGKSYVGKKTREKLDKLIKETNYRPHRLARALSIQKTNMIGLLIHDVWYSYDPELIQSVQTTLRQKGYNMILCLSHNDPEQEAEELEMLLSIPVDGIIIGPTIHPESLPTCKKLTKEETPFVMINQRLEGVACSSVRSNIPPAITKLTVHLIEQGHKKIAYIGSAQSDPYSMEQYNSFLKVLNDHGLEFHENWVVWNHDFSDEIEHGRRAMKRLLELDNKPTAVLSVNDIEAIGAHKAVTEKGLNIPKDIALAGFGDLQRARELTPPLTTVKEHPNLIGQQAVETLIDLIEGNRKKNVNILVDCSLVVRESC